LCGGVESGEYGAEDIGVIRLEADGFLCGSDAGGGVSGGVAGCFQERVDDFAGVGIECSGATESRELEQLSAGRRGDSFEECRKGFLELWAGFESMVFGPAFDETADDEFEELWGGRLESGEQGLEFRFGGPAAGDVFGDELCGADGRAGQGSFVGAEGFEEGGSVDGGGASDCVVFPKVDTWAADGGGEDWSGFFGRGEISEAEDALKSSLGVGVCGEGAGCEESAVTCGPECEDCGGVSADTWRGVFGSFAGSFDSGRRVWQVETVQGPEGVNGGGVEADFVSLGIGGKFKECGYSVEGGAFDEQSLGLETPGHGGVLESGDEFRVGCFVEWRPVVELI
jgi:hypothetical protein